jgi:hypothetical protein
MRGHAVFGGQADNAFDDTSKINLGLLPKNAVRPGVCPPGVNVLEMNRYGRGCKPRPANNVTDGVANLCAGRGLQPRP